MQIRNSRIAIAQAISHISRISNSCFSSVAEHHAVPDPDPDPDPVPDPVPDPHTQPARQFVPKFVLTLYGQFLPVISSRQRPGANILLCPAWQHSQSGLQTASSTPVSVFRTQKNRGLIRGHVPSFHKGETASRLLSWDLTAPGGDPGSFPH